MPTTNLPHTPRSMAVAILLQGEKTGAPIDQLRDEELRRHRQTDSRDRRLVMALVYGVLRWQRYLDWVLAAHANHPLHKMKPLTLQALRVALFQTLFMDRIPDSAAINETIKILHSARQPRWLTGFVNALLRAISAKKNSLPLPSDEVNVPWRVGLSHPDWLLDRWQDRYGHDATVRICQLNNTPPSLVLRLNPARSNARNFLAAMTQAGIDAQPGAMVPDSVVLQGALPAVEELPGYAEGQFMVQDQGAQLIPLLFGAPLVGPVLDGCAGLGGKTSHLASLLPAGSRLMAVEPHAARIVRLRENLTRLGYLDRVKIIPATLAQYANDCQEHFQTILLDVPCSGLGVIRRHPEIRWHRQPADLTRYQAMQSELLDIAAPLLAAGGVLVYATCSTEPEENEEAIDRFLEHHPDFALSPCALALPPVARVFLDGRGFFRTIPNLSGTDGFFAARLVKTA